MAKLTFNVKFYHSSSLPRVYWITSLIQSTLYSTFLHKLRNANQPPNTTKMRISGIHKMKLAKHLRYLSVNYGRSPDITNFIPHISLRLWIQILDPSSTCIYSIKIDNGGNIFRFLNLLNENVFWLFLENIVQIRFVRVALSYIDVVVQFSERVSSITFRLVWKMTNEYS